MWAIHGAWQIWHKTYTVSSEAVGGSLLDTYVEVSDLLHLVSGRKKKQWKNVFLYYLWNDKSMCKWAIKKRNSIFTFKQKKTTVFIGSEFIFFNLAFVEFMHFFPYIKIFTGIFCFSYYSLHNAKQFKPNINKTACTHALLMSSVKKKMKIVI